MQLGFTTDPFLLNAFDSFICDKGVSRYPEEPCKLSFCHGNFSDSLADDLHITAPIKTTTMIVRAGHCSWFMARIHAVSSILQVIISEGSQASLSIVSFSFTDCLAMSLSISSDIFLSVTCA